MTLMQLLLLVLLLCLSPWILYGIGKLIGAGVARGIQSAKDNDTQTQEEGEK